MERSGYEDFEAGLVRENRGLRNNDEVDYGLGEGGEGRG